MDSVFDGVLSAAADGVLNATSGEPDDIPKTNTTVWILGKNYNSIQGWFTLLFFTFLCCLGWFVCGVVWRSEVVVYRLFVHNIIASYYSFLSGRVVV